MGGDRPDADAERLRRRRRIGLEADYRAGPLQTLVGDEVG